MLTEEWLRANVGMRRDQVLEIADTDGLSVRISYRGHVVFQMRYLLNGIQRRLDLGRYPRMSLPAARTENARLRVELSNGRDPRFMRMPKNADTIEGLFRSWYDQFSDKRQPNRSDVLRLFERYVFPTIGAREPAAVTLEEWLEVVGATASAGQRAAVTLHDTAKNVLAWAVSLKLLPFNALAQVPRNMDRVLRT